MNIISNKWAYYNEIDPKAAAWIRELIKAKLITDGEVDERSIVDVQSNDVRNFRRCHWFAGIAGWEYALRLAGIPDDYPVWTASLPCQPFSAAGKQLGKADERHLLPHFLALVRQCKPRILFGEQVANAITVTGQLRNQDQDLQLLQKKQAYIRLLAELQRSGGKSLRTLQELGEIEKEGKQTEKLFELQEMANREQGCRLGQFCDLSGKRAGFGFGHYGGMGAGEDRFGFLRNDRNTLRFGDPESLECALFRQNRQQSGLSEEQYESRALCLECDDEYLGRTEDFGSIEWDHESAQEQIHSANREIDESLEGTHTRGWLDDLQATMEAEGYTVGAAVLGAHSVGSFHQRQRLYWVADSSRTGSQRSIKQNLCGTGWREERGSIASNSQVNRMGDTASVRQCGRFSDSGKVKSKMPWAGPEITWLECRDNKYRPIKPGIKPLVDGLPRGMVRSSDSGAPILANETGEARAMRLKGYGNAIVPQVAAEFISAFMDVLNER
jgi:site-specific DNA-cytosine methylase